MTRTGAPTPAPGSRYEPLLLVLPAVLALTAVLQLTGTPAFRPYFGGLSPLLAVGASALIGAAALAFLDARAGFAVRRAGETRAGLKRAAALATLLAAVMIGVDLAAPYPPDINVPLPQSAAFYPVMAFVVEAVFHAAPLALLLLAVGPLARGRHRETVLWACILAVSLIEPVFQLQATSPGAIPAWSGTYLAVHLLVFNLLQLFLFKRFDFLTMFGFRLVYYAWWHIGWGWLRLQVLF